MRLPVSYFILFSFFLALFTQGLPSAPPRHFIANLVLPTTLTIRLASEHRLCQQPVFAQQQHFCSWASFRNQVMLCICLVDLLSPFVLVQLLLQLSSPFPSNLCYLPTLLLYQLQYCRLFSLLALVVCQQCQHWYWASKPDWKQQMFSRTSRESLS